MSKWILIEVENQSINKPDAYDTYEEAFDEMKSRYESFKEIANAGSFYEMDAYIQTYCEDADDLYNIDWKIYEVKCD